MKSHHLIFQLDKHDGEFLAIPLQLFSSLQPSEQWQITPDSDLYVNAHNVGISHINLEQKVSPRIPPVLEAQGMTRRCIIWYPETRFRGGTGTVHLWRYRKSYVLM